VHGPGPVYVHSGRAGLRPSLPGRRCERARWTSRASTRSRSTRPLMSTLVRTVFAQPDAASAWAQHVGSWTSSPSASRPRPNCWPTPPLTCWHSRHFPRRLAPDQVQQSQERLNSELAERVYRLEVCLCSRIISGPGSSRFPLGPESQPVSTSIAPQPGTQEIASSNYLSVLVFVHFIEPAFTIGVETSFQILEIRSQWLHSPSSSSNRFLSIGHNIRRIWTGSRSDQRAGMAVRQEPRSRRPGGRRPHRRALPLVWARAARGRPDTRSGGLAFAVLIG
jgi:hypothetical protein